MGLGIDADKFHLLSEDDYLQPFPFSGLPRDLKEAYTENVYQFYDEFFPGVKVHRRGKIFVSDLDKALQGAALSHYGPKRKFYEKLLKEVQYAQEKAEQAQRSKGQKCPMIDFYAAREFIVRMKRVIACVDNGFNVLRTLTYASDSWATFYHTSQQFYQNYFNMVTSNDGSIDMNEVKKTYEDAKRRFPDSDAFAMSADEHVEVVLQRYDLDNSRELTYGEAREWILSFAWFFDGNKLKEQEQAEDTDAEDTPCGEYRTPTPPVSPISHTSFDGPTSDIEDDGLLADVSVLRETVIQINIANKRALESLKLASSKVRDHRNSIIRSLYHGSGAGKSAAIRPKTRSGKDITHKYGGRVFFTTLGMNITTALDKGYDETVFNATKSIECYVDDCVFTLNQIKNTLDRKDLLDAVGEQAMEEIRNTVANIFKPPAFPKHQSDFRKWGSNSMKNTLDSGSGMTLEEQVDYDKDKVFKNITADYVILKQSKLNALPKGAKLLAKQSWNTIFGKEAGNALSSFREEMIDTINNRINLLNKLIKEKITFLANASRAVNKVEDGFWTYSIKELTAQSAIENLADDNMDLVHALMQENSESLYQRESDMDKLASTFSTLRRNPKEMIEASNS